MVSLTFLIIGYNDLSLPFSIEVNEDELFNNVIIRAIDKETNSNQKFLKKDKIVTTLSADIPVKTEELVLSIKIIIKNYGNAFCIRLD